MFLVHRSSRDRIVVSTLRCGRSNPGSNPGHGSGDFYHFLKTISQKMQKCTISSSSLVCSHYKFINALSLLTTAFSHSSIDKLPSTAKLSLEIGRNYALRLTFTITKLSLIPHE